MDCHKLADESMVPPVKRSRVQLAAAITMTAIKDTHAATPAISPAISPAANTTAASHSSPTDPVTTVTEATFSLLLSMIPVLSPLSRMIMKHQLYAKVPNRFVSPL